MRIAQLLPRGMAFEAQHASSVELCVSEWVSGSRHRATTTIVAERSDKPPLLDVAIARLPPARRLRAPRLALAMRTGVAGKPDVIVTQQHANTAAQIALANRDRPVVLQTHNLIDPPVTGRGAAAANWMKRREFATLAGLTLVSEAARADFERNWPEVTVPRAVVTNGCDFSTWHPAPASAREKRIMVVGRNQPEKGIAEAAAGVRAFLHERPDWRATFVLSATDANEPYFAQVLAAMGGADAQCEILISIPFAEVKRTTERAMIALVASRWTEPFGRTALEAHAGGAALISSGTGGLAEISGDAALYLDAVTPEAITAALGRLADDHALREDLASRGAQRVRTLFPLAAADGRTDSVCARLDTFLETIVASHASASAA